MFLNKWIDRIGDWNPQLFRELKGRLTRKSIGLMVLVSGIIQSLVYFSFSSSLPYSGQNTHHYCVGTAPANWDPEHYLYSNQNWCLTDSLGNITSLNWPLWWTEMFISIALLGFFGILIGGTYLLIQDLSKEQRQGTLNFVTLTPQSALAIALGKIMGVPTFIYGMIAFALPLHLWAGLKGAIPLHLIMLFYGVLAACCLFAFSGAILYALVGKGGSALKSWLASGALFYFSSMTTMFIMHETPHVANMMDGVTLLNPTHLLHYLVQATAVADQVDWFRYDSLGEITFYGVPAWNSVLGATLAHLMIYGVGTYWFAQAFKRKFHNAQGTLISKSQSYWLTASLVTISLGFTVQEPYTYSSDYNNWLMNFGMLAISGVLYILVLTTALSPSFQSIQDWTRYQGKHSWREWLFGERSPAIWAIALNTVIGFLPIILAGFVVIEKQYYLEFTIGLVMQGLMAILLAAIGMRFLLSRHRKRAIFAATIVLSCIFLPLMIFAFGSINPEFNPAPWLWTITPVVVTQFAGPATLIANLMGQIVAITVINQIIQQRLHQIGSSELKQLLASTPESATS
ncbi:hypothetical protein Lepto7376_1728 [[Leptolyngbya] sp. PCC 7376]|uniref:hypothetical protein n=1 Tax=[Leptolyngbya] sp. PCC 7376 TaxID=111781 RepID=UPI00029EE1D2|nr:hypothetical protein [[Leptolyngbya] sp. PCC 7376]AFY38062.1 hypothetical protein Lepto7376_1728 [[Leptolyngbya] sp. PCC 7376]